MEALFASSWICFGVPWKACGVEVSLEHCRTRNRIRWPGIECPDQARTTYPKEFGKMAAYLRKKLWLKWLGGRGLSARARGGVATRGGLRIASNGGLWTSARRGTFSLWSALSSVTAQPCCCVWWKPSSSITSKLELILPNCTRLFN